MIGKKNNANPNPRIFEIEYLVMLNQALNILGLSKHNVESLGNCQMLSLCLAYFGKNKHDENNHSKDVVKFKWSIVNSFHRTLMDHTVLEKHFNFWSKHAIRDSLHRDYHMNDVAIGFMSCMLNQNIFIFYLLYNTNQV